MNSQKIPSEDRFIALVKETSTCWLWIGAKDKDGYGNFQKATRMKERAHRWIWKYLIGPIPKDKFICHTCDTPSCVNLAHLYVGTAQSNANDKVDRNRQSRIGPPTKVKKEETTQLQSLYNKGTPVKELATQRGVSRATLYNHIKAEKQLSIGATGRPIKISLDETTNIQNRYKAGVSVSKLADEYDVHEMTIYRVLKRGM